MSVFVRHLEGNGEAMNEGSMMLSEETKQKILALQTLYPERRSALIPALHLAQRETGYLSTEIQREVAHLFGLDLNEINAIVTFYEMFFEEPLGKHLIRVCKNMSCMLRGGDELMNTVCSALRVKPGETTDDGEWTVIASECLAACDRAPMMMVDHQVIGPIKDQEIDAILAQAKGASDA